MERAMPVASADRWSITRLAEVLMASPLLALSPAWMVPVLLLLGE